MVTKVNDGQVAKGPDGKSYNRSKYYCKSTDPQPTGARNGDTLYEMDKVDGKHRLWMFDEDTGEWILQ